RDFARLAMAEADAPLLVADHYQRGEAEAPAALHHLGDAVNVDELVGELAVPLFPVPLAFAFTCHENRPFRLEVQPAFAGRVGPPLAAAMIHVAAAVERDVLAAGRRRALGEPLADRLGGVDVGAGLERAAHLLLERGRRGDGRAFAVVDHLRI